MGSTAWGMCNTGYQNSICTWTMPTYSPPYASSDPSLTSFALTTYNSVNDAIYTNSSNNNSLSCPVY